MRKKNWLWSRLVFITVLATGLYGTTFGAVRQV